MWTPTRLRFSARWASRTASSASPVAMAKPNLLSRVPVVVCLWVWGSTSGEARTRTSCRLPASPASRSSRSSSWKLSTTTRPMPASSASRSSWAPLVVAVEVDALGRHAPREGHGELAA